MTCILKIYYNGQHEPLAYNLELFVVFDKGTVSFCVHWPFTENMAIGEISFISWELALSFSTENLHFPQAANIASGKRQANAIAC